MNKISILFALLGCMCINNVLYAQELCTVKLSNLSVYKGTFFDEPAKTSALNLCFVISNPEELQFITANLYRIEKGETIFVEEKVMPLVMFNGKRVVKVGDVPFLIFNNKVELDWLLASPVELNNYVVTLEGVDNAGKRTLMETIELFETE